MRERFQRETVEHDLPPLLPRQRLQPAQPRLQPEPGQMVPLQGIDRDRLGQKAEMDAARLGI